MLARVGGAVALGVALLALQAGPASAAGVTVTCPGPVFFGGVQLPDITNGAPSCLVTVPGASLTTSGHLEAVTGFNPASSTTGTFTYDEHGRLLRVGDTVGNQTTFASLPGTLASGGATTFTYDGTGHVTSATGPAGATDYVYDATGNLIDVSSPGGTTTFKYDSAGRMISAGDASFTYSSTGELVSAGGNTFTYDSTGRVILMANPQGTTPFTYDAAGRLVSAGSTTFSYENGGRLVQVATPAGTTNFTYDSAGNLISAGKTTYAYNAGGELISTTDPQTGTTNFVYDGAGNLITVGEPGGSTEQFTWLGVSPPDTTPPTITATATSNGSAYVGGTWTRFDVVVHFTCVDNPGGSGVAALTGDQTVSTEGADQSRTGTCTDKAGNSATVTFGGIDIDKTPPTVTATALTVDATGPSGATVPNYPATAADNLDPSPVIICTPAAPHTFAIGDTPVSCTATDHAGNVSPPATFTVHVIGASGQLTALSSGFAALSLPTGLENDLGHKLDNATKALAQGHVDQAVQKLVEFSSGVALDLRKKQPAIDPSDGQSLIAAANQIELVLGSTPPFVATTVRSGDFNGDGRADLAEFDSATGVWMVGISNGSKFTFSHWATWSPAVTWVDVQVGDFNGDGKADIAGRVLSTGQWWVAQSMGG